MAIRSYLRIKGQAIQLLHSKNKVIVVVVVVVVTTQSFWWLKDDQPVCKKTKLEENKSKVKENNWMRL